MKSSIVLCNPTHSEFCYSDVISSSCQHILSKALHISITCLSVGLSAFDEVPGWRLFKMSNL